MNDLIPGVYSHSGKLGTAAVIVPIGGLIASVVLSVIYAYVDVYSPIGGYVSLLFVAGLAFGLGWSISKLGHLARCRNSGFLHLAGLVGGLVALYTSWAVFEYALIQRFEEGVTVSVLGIFFSPVFVWSYAEALNAVGWYTMFGGTPTGVTLWVFWGIEAIIIVGGSTLLSTMKIGEEVYCEDCDRWCGRTVDAARFGFPEEQSELEELRPDNLNPILALDPADSSAAACLRADVWKCETCNDTAALQVKVCATVTDKDGKSEEKVEDLTQIWSMPSIMLSEIMNRADHSPDEETPASE